MATLALTAASSAGYVIGIGVAGPVGVFAAGIAAAAIDGLLIYPSLFKKDPVEGQRLNGLDFQKTEEGVPSNRLFGEKNRVAGTLVWASPLREVEDREGSAKGGSGGEFIRFKYFCDIAVEIARNRRGETLPVPSKVLADGKEFFNNSGLLTYADSDDISAETITIRNLDDELAFTTTLRLVSDESTGGPNLTVFQSGRDLIVSGFTASSDLTGLIFVETTGATSSQNGSGDVFIRILYSPIESVLTTRSLFKGDTLTIDGFTYVIAATVAFTGSSTVDDIQNVEIATPLQTTLSDGDTLIYQSSATNNNGRFRIYKSGRLSSTKSYVNIKSTDEGLIAFADKPAGIDEITLEQEDTSFSKSQAGDVRFYGGSLTQLPDAVMIAQEEARLGVGSVPALRGRAYMIVEDLEVTDFGNRIPSFEFIIDSPENDFLGKNIKDMLLDAGLSESEIDVSGIPNTTTLGGYVIRGPQSIKVALQPIMLAYNLVSQEDDGKIKIFPRTNTSLVDVTGKTGAFVPPDKPPRPGRFFEVGDSQIAQTSVVKYYDFDNDLQTGKKQAQGSVGISDQTGEYTTNLTLTGTQAQQLANIIFELSGVAGRRSFKFSLPPSYIPIIKESVRVRIVAFNQDREFLITRVEEGANFILECEAIEEDITIFTQEIVAEENQAI